MFEFLVIMLLVMIVAAVAPGAISKLISAVCLIFLLTFALFAFIKDPWPATYAMLAVLLLLGVWLFFALRPQSVISNTDIVTNILSHVAPPAGVPQDLQRKPQGYDFSSLSSQDREALIKESKEVKPGIYQHEAGIFIVKGPRGGSKVFKTLRGALNYSEKGQKTA